MGGGGGIMRLYGVLVIITNQLLGGILFILSIKILYKI